MKRSKFFACIFGWLILADMTMTTAHVYSAEKGILVILTEPADAKLYINGKRKGNSPAQASDTFAIKLPEGEYKVEGIKQIGFPMELYGVKADIYVAGDSEQTITLKLFQRPLQEFKDKFKAKYKNGVPEPKMVAVPGGSFKMGCVSGKDCESNEKPVHTVNLSTFEISATEITFEQWDGCVADGGCAHYPDDVGWGRDNHPVINVSWKDVQQYISWLNKKTGKTYRLPTDAEWEYAARAGNCTKYSWGNEIGKNKANCKNCGSKWDDKQTAPVGSFQANGFGLYDMHGNVYERVQDWPYFRGGCYYSFAKDLRSAHRGRPGFIPPREVDRLGYLGFRLVRQP